ncbi:MAG: hypothetical protein M1813_000915 [Trichoglossum hirsutum]|jgi:hypothetical protein|nr:MAG: hypothetical protein M1813_000915 [Trichoglossum hirsutum]
MATNAPSRRRREPRTSDSSNNNISRNSGTNTNAVFANSDNVSEQQRRREKKRAQNRLSQQSCREKQASYVRQLERFVENIQAAGLGMAASGGTESQAYTQQLQNRLWNTMKENQELRDAMLRMRKKMMSLSASAQSGAGAIAIFPSFQSPSLWSVLDSGGRETNS